MSYEDRAVQRAQSLGHTVEPDHPWGMTQVRRWTCKACGDAVLVNGTVIYGSASTDPCWETGEPMDRADPPAEGAALGGTGDPGTSGQQEGGAR